MTTEAGIVNPEIPVAIERRPPERLGVLAGYLTTPHRSTEQPTFYNEMTPDDDLASREAERLKMMAELAADKMSQRALGNEEGVNNKKVADIGAGNSPALSKWIKDAGGDCISYDPRGSAVEAHRQAGLDAHIATADQIDLRSGSVDITHARFLYGWLDGDREAALREAIRITKPGGRIVIIDYDWSAIKFGDAEVGDEVKERLYQIFSLAIDTMKMAGFDPLYGKYMTEDLSQISGKITSRYGGTIVMEPEGRRSVFNGTLGDQITTKIFDQTAESIIAGIEPMGLHERATELRDAQKALRSIVEQYPAMSVQLADIVVQGLTVEDAPEIPEAQGGRQRQRDCSPDEYMKIVDWGDGRQVVAANSKELIESLRRIQGSAYVKDGLVSEEVLKDGGGKLPPEIDSQDRIDHSKYFTVVDKNKDKSPQYCTIRYVYTDSEHGLAFLDEYRRASPEARKAIVEKYQPEDVVAISSLAKNFEQKDSSLKDIVGAVIGMVQDLRDHKKKIGIMELDVRKYETMKSVFGADNFEEIGEPHLLTKEGREIDGVNLNQQYIMLRCDVEKFLDRMLANADNNIARAKNGETADLFWKIKRAIESL